MNTSTGYRVAQASLIKIPHSISYFAHLHKNHYDANDLFLGITNYVFEKFQQKALKQTKQKKSKSAEFLMGEDEIVATEGIANPAFNISSAGLSAYQTSEEDVIRRDKLGSTLAAHQQKLRLQARAKPRGNECCRNYFDPLMDEEINPRQCGMEVSKEVPMKLDEAELLYDKLMTFLDNENRIFMSPETHVKEKCDTDPRDSSWPVSCKMTSDLCEEVEEATALPYIEQFEKDVQDEIVLLGNSALQQLVAVQRSFSEEMGTVKKEEELIPSLPSSFSCFSRAVLSDTLDVITCFFLRVSSVFVKVLQDVWTQQKRELSFRHY
nr:orofacial cleft 1 candidate gene 1 protein homolog [Pogona vitticeps]